MGGTRKKGGYPSGKEESKKRSSSVLISAVFYSSHGMRRETICNIFTFHLHSFVWWKKSSWFWLSVCNTTPYTGCIEPGVNWHMLLRIMYLLNVAISWRINLNKCLIPSQFYSSWVKKWHKWSVLYPFCVKYAKISSNYWKMAEFSTKNVR